MSNNAASTKHKNPNPCRDYTCPACYPALFNAYLPQTDVHVKVKVMSLRVHLSDGRHTHDPYGASLELTSEARRSAVGRLCFDLPMAEHDGLMVDKSTVSYRNKPEFGMLFIGQLSHQVKEFQLAALIWRICHVEVVAVQWFIKKHKKNGAWVAIRGGTTAAQIVIDRLGDKALCFPHNHFIALATDDAEVDHLAWFVEECRPCLKGGAANRLTVQWAEPKSIFVQQPPSLSDPSSDDEDGRRGAPLPQAPLAAPAQKPFATSGRKPTG